MEIVWIFVALAVGGVAVYLLDKPRLQRAEDTVAAEKMRVEELSASQQKLEIENAALRVSAERVTELSTKVSEDQLKILGLTEKSSSAAVSVMARDETIQELKSKILVANEELIDLRSKLTAAGVESATLSSTIVERETALKNERAQLEQSRATLRTQFVELSTEVLRGNSDTFLESAKRVLEQQRQEGQSGLDSRQEEIKNLIRPIVEGLNAVGSAARDMETARATAFGSIEEQLRQSVSTASEVARQASALRDALKRPNVRGRWGEVQLKICVELAGMEEHCDVEFQETSLSPEDEALRPDMIVRVPGGRKITVDSKTPMDHFLTYIEASTDEDRQTALINHGRAVKKHVGDLAKTDYMHRIAEGPDFVIMFLPNESFLAMALEKEPSLMEEALNKKILIATPGTLIGLLKVVMFGWNEQKLAQNAQLISDEGSKLNGELVKFLADFAKLTIAIESLNEAFGISKRRVETQIAKSSLTLAALGAKNRSPLPKRKKVLARVTSLLKAAGADDEEIEQMEDQEHFSFAASVQEEEEEEDEDTNL